MFRVVARTTLILLASACLILASGQAEAGPNSVASSTWVFEGPLTDAGGGIYTGTIDATVGFYYVTGGAGEAIWASGGVDLYGLDGGCALVEGYYATGAWNCAGVDTFLIPAVGENHDAYPSALGGGPWGSFYNPDIQDDYNYELTLSATNWYVRYKSAEMGTPMSGAMNWPVLYASEDDIGAYVNPPADPDANDGGCANHGAGAGWWDMDWSWGSDCVPLQHAGFDVDITDLGGGDYRVVLTPSDPTGVPTLTTGMVVLLGVGLIGLLAFALTRRQRTTA